MLMQDKATKVLGVVGWLNVPTIDEAVGKGQIELKYRLEARFLYLTT